MTRPAGTTWRTPAALILISVIPLVAGALRLLEVAGGPQLIPANPRIDAAPAPLVVHVLAAAVYALLGALQFSARLRRRRPGSAAGGRPGTGRPAGCSSRQVWSSPAPGCG